MNHAKFLPMLALVLLFGAGPGADSADAGRAVMLTPVYVDPDEGYLYFLVRNRWHRTIATLFGQAYGYGDPRHPGAYPLNDRHAMAMKVSLGPHLPGTAALYRVPVPPERLTFPGYHLLVNDDGLRHPERFQ